MTCAGVYKAIGMEPGREEGKGERKTGQGLLAEKVLKLKVCLVSLSVLSGEAELWIST